MIMRYNKRDKVKIDGREYTKEQVCIAFNYNPDNPLMYPIAIFHIEEQGGKVEELKPKNNEMD